MLKRVKPAKFVELFGLFLRLRYPHSDTQKESKKRNGRGEGPHIKSLHIESRLCCSKTRMFSIEQDLLISLKFCLYCSDSVRSDVSQTGVMTMFELNLFPSDPAELNVPDIDNCKHRLKTCVPRCSSSFNFVTGPAPP